MYEYSKNNTYVSHVYYTSINIIILLTKKKRQLLHTKRRYPSLNVACTAQEAPHFVTPAPSAHSRVHFREFA